LLLNIYEHFNSSKVKNWGYSTTFLLQSSPKYLLSSFHICGRKKFYSALSRFFNPFTYKHIEDKFYYRLDSCSQSLLFIIILSFPLNSFWMSAYGHLHVTNAIPKTSQTSLNSSLTMVESSKCRIYVLFWIILFIQSLQISNVTFFRILQPSNIKKQVKTAFFCKLIAHIMLWFFLLLLKDKLLKKTLHSVES